MLAEQKVQGRFAVRGSTTCCPPFQPRSFTSEGTASIFEIDPINDLRWDNLVLSHPQSSVFQSTQWLKALQSAYGYKPIAVTTCPPGVPLSNGLVFCHVKSRVTGERLVALPFSDYCDPLLDNSEQFSALLRCMQQKLKDSKAYIELRPRTGNRYAENGFRRAAKYYAHALDLRKNLTELFQGFHKDCVCRKIRRAEREKLTYLQGNSGDLLSDFYRMFVMTRRRHGLPPPPLSWFKEVVACFGERSQVRVVYKQAEPVASILTLSHKKTLVYKYGCCNVDFNQLGGMALLFWTTIQQAKSAGFEQLDFGRSDVQHAGLIAFKERWGARRSEVDYWTYPYAETSLPLYKVPIVKRITTMLPTVILRAVGTFLYKHIG